MATVITVPVGERTKSIKFGATYTPNLSFNPDKELFFGCSGVLTGLGITVDTGPTPNEVTVDPGAFIQRGIIVNVSNPQLLQFPDPLPVIDLFLVAENPNEIFNSSVTMLFTTAPAADSVIIAKWVAPITTTVFTTETKLGICELRDALDGVLNFFINRDRQVATGGQQVFTLPAGKEYVLGANKLAIYRNGKKLDITVDYSEDNPNQITLNFGATAGDILEFIIIQSEPPITSLALTNLTDITGDLSDAIKDVSTFRAATASASNPLATFADLSSVTPVFVVESKDDTSGVVATSSIPLVDIASPALAFTQIITGPVQVTITGTMTPGLGGTGQGVSQQFAASLDGTTFEVMGRRISDLEGSNCFSGTVIFPAVPPGAHTIRVAHAYIFVGFATDARILRQTDAPLRVTVRHT